MYTSHTLTEWGIRATGNAVLPDVSDPAAPAVAALIPMDLGGGVKRGRVWRTVVSGYCFSVGFVVQAEVLYL